MLGKVLGEYRIDSELGSGGMGTVYRATAADGKVVALKIVHPHLLSREGFIRRFQREAEVGRAIRHENVVRTYRAETLPVEGMEQHFFVMEYVEGQTLRELLDELGPIPEALCRHVGREITRGLEAIHAAGVIHRDLKPENVLITPDHVVKVMDLGVARLAEEALRLSQTGAFVGSLQYAAPEQFRAPTENVDARVDLHALGLILYELATGTNPFLAEEAHRILVNISSVEPPRLGERCPQATPFFEHVVHRLLEKDREKRFSGASRLLGVLEEGESSLWWRKEAQSIRAVTRKPLRRIRLPRETDVFGRAEEVRKLRLAYERAKEGEARTVLIEGEAGIGKTRLVDELLLELEAAGEDLHFLFGGYLPGGAATAEGAYSTAYREHLGEERLEAALAEHLPQTPTLVPAFAALLRGTPPPPGAEPLHVDSIHSVFLQVTRSLAREKPAILLVDDLHLAPDEGRALFAALATALQDERILLVGAFRPGLPKDWLASVERSESCEALALKRLGPKDLTGLLVQAFRSERLAKELAFSIAEKSDGNPFFVFEIIRGLREGGSISRAPDGTWVRTGEITEIRVPSSLLDLIQSRIALLAEDERELLEVASCLGFEFDARIAAAALERPRIPVLRSLAQIEKEHRLVRSVGRRFRFDHHQVHRALYDGLPLPLREEYHATLGRALLVLAGETPDGPVTVQVCEQFLAGESGERAREHLEPALDHLVEGHLNAPAIALADRALEVEGLLEGRDRIQVLIRKAEILELTGRMQDQVDVLEAAIRLADEFGDPNLACRTRQLHGNTLRMLGQTESAIEMHEEAARLAREAGDKRQEASVLGNLGSDLADQGRYEAAGRLFEESLALSRESDDRRAEGGAIGNLALILWEMGHFEESTEKLVECLGIFREIGYRRGEGMALGNLGLAYYQQGRYEEARRSYREHLKISREIGYRRGEGLAEGNLGLLCQSLGDYADAWHHYRRQAEITREIGNPMHIAMCHQSLGHLLLELGELERARAEIETAITLIGEGQWIWGEAAGYHLLGILADFTGDPGRAEEEYRRCLEVRERLGALEGIAVVRCALGALLMEQGRTGEARPELEAAREAAVELGLPATAVLSTTYLACLPGGDTDAAREALRAHAERIGPPTVMEARFMLFRAAGDPADLEAAYRILGRTRDRSPEEFRESLVTRVPANRDLVAAWVEHGGASES